MEERPELAQQLGDLYFQVGLYVQAEQNYQAALAAAQARQKPLARAEALVGLGRVAEAFGERETAISHFQAAETLFRAAGDTGPAEAVAHVLAELAINPKVVFPSASPTP